MKPVSRRQRIVKGKTLAASSGLPLAAILTAVPRPNFLDRTIFNILIEPIKREFVLSDPCDGPACVLRYFVARHRKSAGGGAEPLQDVAVAFARPSAIAFLLGKAPKVATPTSARIGVGIGEPVDTPDSQSLVAHLFDQNEPLASARVRRPDGRHDLRNRCVDPPPLLVLIGAGGTFKGLVGPCSPSAE